MKKKKFSKFFSLLATLALLFNTFSASLISAQASPSPTPTPTPNGTGGPPDTVDICHSTGSHSNPYIVNSPSKSGDVSGHDADDGPIWFSGITVVWGDIIPPFDYDGGSYPGKNWTTEGEAFWNNDCNIPEPEPEPSSITVVKDEVPDGSTEFTFFVSGPDFYGANFSLTDGNNVVLSSLLSGEYTITETNSAFPYTTSISCSNEASDTDENITFELEEGEDVTCTFTNTKGTFLKVYKVTDPQEEIPTEFGITLKDGNGILEERTLTTTSPATFEVEPGTYWVDETGVPGGWGGNDSECQEVVVEQGDFAECTIYNTKLGSLQGRKYNDFDGDGEMDWGDEDWLNDWTIRLYNSQWGSENERTTGHTGLVGQYSFTDLKPDTYYACEVLEDGWTQTAPSVGMQSQDNGGNLTGGLAVANGSGAGDEGPVCWGVEIEPGSGATWLLIGNQELGSIFGYKYEDIDGSLNTDEYLQNPVQGWEIELWQDLVNMMGSTTTAPDGSYSFTDLLTGDYRVVEETRAGWTNMTPAFMSVELAPGESEGLVDFVNYQHATVRVCKEDTRGRPVPGWGIGVNELRDETGDDGCADFTLEQLGDYLVTEEQRGNWTQIGDTSFRFTAESGGVYGPFTFVNFKHARVYGYKFNDLDGDGIWDDGEPGLENWTINVNGPRGWSSSTTTDENGYYRFRNLPYPGEYNISEILQPEWTQTFPRGGTHTIGARSNSQFTNRNFGNVRLSDVHGFKWNDVNGNGERDEDEGLLGGWSIGILKSDGEGGWTPVNSMVTPEGGERHGWYWFEDLLPGIYKACERTKPGWNQTYPMDGRIPGCHLLTLPDNNHNGQENGVDGPLYNFGNQGRGSITVLKNVDVNGDGDLEDDEDLIGTDRWTWTINGRGEFRTGDTHQLPVGTYLIAENQVPGYHVTSLSCNREPRRPRESTSIVLGPGEDVTCVFTNTRDTGNIYGWKWNDLNGNGRVNEGERGLEGWEINLYKGRRELVATTTTDGAGNYSFEGIPTGDYYVCEVNQEGWDQTYPEGCHGINLTRRGQDGVNFGNQGRGSITVLKNVDTDGDGDIDIFGTNRWTWTINGRGEFRTGDTHELPAGTYLIAENQVPGYHVTGFACRGLGQFRASESNSVPVGPGEDITCVFTNTRDTGDIYGWKWSDEDGSGKPDEGERGLEGWTINLYKGEELIATTTTDEDGNYSFEGVPTGDYQVCEVNQKGWDQTYPYLESCHEVSLEEDGQEYDGVDFGNWEEILGISIDKSNDMSGGAYAGDTAIYTLVVTNDGNRTLNDVEVFDALPGGFDYVEGSTLIDGAPSADPVESGGKLTWNIGALAAGNSATIEYQVEIPSDTVDGVYTNLASCKARYGGLVLNTHDENGFFDPAIAFFSNDNGGEWIECNIADSSVPIGSALDISAGVEPQVLGIKTELPAAGNDTELMMGIMLAGALGFVFKLVSKKLYEEDN